MIDIESKIISYREDTNDYRLCLTREEIEEIKGALAISETWITSHGKKIIVAKGTFDKIWNDKGAE